PRLAGELLNFDREKVAELFRALQFRTLLNRIPEPARTTAAPGGQLSMFDSAAPEDEPAPAAPEGPTRTTVVNTPEALAALVKKLNNSQAIAFDTETTSTNQMRARLVGIALAVEEGEGYYIPLTHEAEAAPPQGQLPLAAVLAALEAPLTDPKIEKYAHTAGYDYVVLKRAGLVVQPLSFDTMLAEWLCDPGSRNLGLKNLAWVRLGIEMTEIKKLLGTGKKQKTMDQIPVALAAPYAAADVDMTLRLVPLLRPELEDKGVGKLLADIEMPLVTVLADMEMAGVELDADFLAEMSQDLAGQLDTIAKSIFKAVGHEFNLNSTQQLSKALFEDLAITPPHGARRTASGHYSTAADVLVELAEEHGVVRDILEHRELAKLKSTYVDALPLAVNADTGRVHTSYNQTGSVTGRIASSDPNLQNIPIRTEVGRRVRRAFVAPRGRRLVAVDYSQIELRVAAHLSDDQFLRTAFAEGQDIHTATAAAVFNVKLDKVTPDQRRTAKVVNFGLLYGMGAFRLAQNTGITLGEAEEFIETYFERLPGVRRYLDETLAFARRAGYVETLLGRRRYFPILQRPGDTRQDQLARNRAEREAVNAPIQGTAADIIKLAMLELGRRLPQELPEARMLLQVHDELVFECGLHEVDDLLSIVRPVMEGAARLKVPLKVDAKVGANWYEMKEI
ncbi:MAG: DNA polymerase I, partial [Anaerolineales bacterium]